MHNYYADSLSRFRSCSSGARLTKGARARRVRCLEPRHPALAPRLRHLHGVDPIGGPPPVADSGLALEVEAANGLGQSGKVPLQSGEDGGVHLVLESLLAVGLCLGPADGRRGTAFAVFSFAVAPFVIVIIVSS